MTVFTTLSYNSSAKSIVQGNRVVRSVPGREPVDALHRMSWFLATLKHKTRAFLHA